jgi:hypothetical protein
MTNDTDLIALVQQILPGTVIDESPIYTFTKIDAGPYEVAFAYDPEAVDALKGVVPRGMLSWRKTLRRWECSTDWAAHLARALRAAWCAVTGINDLADRVGCLVQPVRVRNHDAYLKGFCARCGQHPHRPGGVECQGCYEHRLLRTERVFAALDIVGAPYPEITSNRGTSRSITRIRTPIPVPPEPICTVITIDSAALERVLADLVDHPGCPICSKTVPKPKTSERRRVHAGCLQRVVAELIGRPFTKSRREAYLDKNTCTICLIRPHRPTTHTCFDCGDVLTALKEDFDHA